MSSTTTVTVTLFGQTREVECNAFGDRIISTGRVLVGRFPTGTKIHRAELVLDRRNAQARPLRGATAAVVDGEEYVASTTLYTHNRNVGRLFGWFDEATPAEAVARW